MSFDYLKSDLIKFSEEAMRSKKEDPKVINATVGVFLNDYNNLYAFPSVSKTIKNLDETLIKSYLSYDGGRRFLKNVNDFLFKDNEELLNNFYINSNWSSGGSGALYLAFKDYKGKDVLLPNSRWSNYDNLSLVLNKNIIEYNLISNNKFDLKNIAKILNKTNEKEIMLLLNDPAHNPTGYNMSVKEYQELIDILNNKKEINISLLIDIAYIDFSSFDYRKKIMPLFSKLNKHVDIYFAYSGSKTFGVYGFRLGALIQLTKKEEKAKLFKETMYKNSQAIYGPPTSISIAFFNNIVKNKNIDKEREYAKQILKKRSKVLIKELQEHEIDYYPYESGFFLTVKTNRPLEDQEKIKEHKCHVVPTHKGLRIALSAIDEKEIIRLVKIIKDVKGGESHE